MATQSLLWTVLPNGYGNKGKSLRVSVLASPRLDPKKLPLDPDAPDQQLAAFPDFVDWPHTIAQAKFVIHFGVQSVTIPGSKVTGPNRVDMTFGVPDSKTWRALLPDSTFVRGHAFRDLSAHSVLSFDAANIDGLVSDLYSSLASSAGEQLPTAETILGDTAWKNLVSAVAYNDELYTEWEPTNTSDKRDFRARLRDSRRQFLDFKNGFKNLKDLKRDLALFQLFHTPAAKTTMEKYGPNADAGKEEARWRGYERSQLPTPNDFQKQIDFHEIVTAMNQYPTLLRRLGLVVDLFIDSTAFNLASNAKLFAEVYLPAGSPNVTRKPDVAPRTRTLLDKTHFQAKTRPALGVGNYVVENGLLNLPSNVFSLMQSDVDGAGIKVMNFARTLLRLRNAPETQIDPVTKHKRELGAPALRNAGLMLMHRNRATMLKNSFDRQKEFNKVAEDIQQGIKSPTLAPDTYAEDLLRGFRIDIWNDKTGEWKSLCQRDARYNLNDGEVEFHVNSEEGTVRLAATTSPDPDANPDTKDIVWLHETLVSWTGWSLCAPAPGKTIRHHREDDPAHPEKDHVDEVRDGEAEVPPGLRLKTAFTAVKHSLPRLRYGRKYWIRARVVDLAGNSLEPASGDFGPEHPKNNAQSYLRYEPISPPAIALLRPALGSTETPAEGESMERIAVRSFNDKPEDNHVPTSQIAHRGAVPARTTQREAEQHGMLDHGGSVDPSFFAMLAAKDNSLALEEIPMSGPLDATPVLTKFAVLEEGQPLPYLPDALAEVIAARIFDHPAFLTIPIEIPLYKPGSGWPTAAPFKIELFEGLSDADMPWFNEATRTLLVPLPKAERVTLRLSVKPTSEQVLNLLGVWNWLTHSPAWSSMPLSERNSLKALAINGQHWMLTPWRNIELVHAVQRPLIEPDIEKHGVFRAFGRTQAELSFQVDCSIKSTSHLDLLAHWNEPAEDLSEKTGKNRERPDHAFAIKITDDKSYGGIHEYERVKNTPDLIAIGARSKKRHEFNDTRYRRIEYWFDATTKFREFMPPSVLIDDNTKKPTDKNIKVTGDKVRTWIPSSAPPPAPEVLYVVPTFGWVRSFDQPDKTSWRRGGGLRVYLDRPWNVSGYGEMLAVVLPSAAFTSAPNTDPMKDPANQPLKNFVTQWGNDPIWLSPFVSGVAPKRSNFPLARTAADPSGNWLPGFAPPEEADQPPGPFKTTDLRHPESLPNATAQSRVEIAPHDVFYDEERQLWYCDIEVNWGTAYYPFIRLALARYQPVSVSYPPTDAYLSHIVLADFMPLVPDRWLNVTQTREPRTKHVRVFGFTFTDSSSHQEAKNSPAKTPALAAANVASSSVIEIWAERFDPAWGEDFGWRREPDAFVQRGVRLLESDDVPVVGNKVTRAKQLARAQLLLQEREFSALIDEKLIDKVFITPTLWDGSVTLPEAPGGKTRYRLVIGEYEEYLVDDDAPYDTHPTRKDRRLVFVEYVELT